MSATQFINCRQCIGGRLISTSLTVDDHGIIIPNSPLSPPTNTIDLKGAIIAPGFIELQINGALGFHFAHFHNPGSYAAGVERIAHHLPSTGVTAFYPTIPTVSTEVFQRALPFLQPSSKPDAASVLGAHVEGPYLQPTKKGAHDAANMHLPSSKPPEVVYGRENLSEAVKIVTLAPELAGATQLIKALTTEYGIAVSMGHSAATYGQGQEGMKAGATLLTHTFNAMNPLHHREPGLVGLISNSPAQCPYYSIIADSIHLHPNIVSLAYRTSPTKCILITDSIELSGLPDGIHPGHSQIPFNQLKEGNKVTIENTDTLVGTCIGLDECVRNLMTWAELGVEQAVRCVTENVAQAMGLSDRGKLEVGRRADFVVLEERCLVKETWVLGRKVHG
ncbi:hypothetical protein BP5796_06397 [Coleophoma crateriformis]|uniref:N-acetylglucosamine-6-phosphate deacetylase n=1 Tax=Coleophoma crateriformis TaxID=565419 RepID=A0A3D8RNP8_9HELO|nr:hypothetical protein BP5796_06397 [Coleophoma crateriformis]